MEGAIVIPHLWGIHREWKITVRMAVEEIMDYITTAISATR